ncbi:unnamed protein product [Ectocarpus sp. 8 AP-2014]
MEQQHPDRALVLVLEHAAFGRQRSTLAAAHQLRRIPPAQPTAPPPFRRFEEISESRSSGVLAVAHQTPGQRSRVQTRSSRRSSSNSLRVITRKDDESNQQATP